MNKKSAYKPGSLKKLKETYEEQERPKVRKSLSYMGIARRALKFIGENINPKEDTEVSYDSDFDEIVGHEDPFTPFSEDPFNPFSSNYNGEPAGPDSFGGSDYPMPIMMVASGTYGPPSVTLDPYNTMDPTKHDAVPTAGAFDKPTYVATSPGPMSQSYEPLKTTIGTGIGLPGVTGPTGCTDPCGQTGPTSLAATLPGIAGLTVNTGLTGFSLTPRETVDPDVKRYMNFEDSRKLDTKEDHGWIQTHSGKKFFPMAPTRNQICIKDIAHALSQICRFTGHCKEFYSVAQHSVLVSYMVEDRFAFAALLHDASEAYITDIASPLKRLPIFQGYKVMENTIQTMIFEKFGWWSGEKPEIKKADVLLLATEARDLMSPLNEDWKMPCNPLPFTIVPLPPKEAKELFLSRFKELMLLAYSGEERYSKFIGE